MSYFSLVMNVFLLILPLEGSFIYAHAYRLLEARRGYLPKLSTNCCTYVPVQVLFNSIVHTRREREVEIKGGREKWRDVKLSLVLN